MKWVDSSRSDKPIPPEMARMLFAGARRQGSTPELRLKAGRAAFEDHDYVSAAGFLGSALSDAVGEPGHWFALAQSLFQLKQFSEALAVTGEGLDTHGVSGELLSVRAKSLHALGRLSDSREAFLRAADHGTADDAMFELFRIAARSHDGALLLREVDLLSERYGDRTIAKANRAIAYSMLGQQADARAYIELDRQIVQRDIREALGEAELESFHASLVEEAKRAAPLESANDIRVEYRPSLEDMPAMQQLFAWARGAFEDCLAGFDPMAEKAWLDTSFDTATLFHAVTMIRNDESNGQHVHRPALISGVYHLLVPEDVSNARDDRGALEVGAVDGYCAGHHAIWGKRLIKPVAGQFTMFPAHIFHDVVPTQSSDLRISIPMDLQVVQPGA